jgi:hypothetical protein
VKGVRCRGWRNVAILATFALALVAGNAGPQGLACGLICYEMHSCLRLIGLP